MPAPNAIEKISDMASTRDQVAVIDLSDWLARTPEGDAVAMRLVDSFRKVGFVYVIGHGIAAEAVTAIFRASYRLFQQTPAQLDKVHYRHAGHYHGYVPKGVLAGTGSFHELYDCGMDIGDDYQGPGAYLSNMPNPWPEDLPGFRETVEGYQQLMRPLADELLAAIGVGLGLPRDFFQARSAIPHAQLRLLHYLPRPDAPDDALSVGRHSDYEAVTILAQDDVGGLQVRDPHGQWMDIKPIEGAFLINAGDMLVRWTNGTIPATPHRVRTPRERERYSVAFFYGTSYDVVMEPVLPPAHPVVERHEPVTGGEYLWQRFTEHGI
ncbi:2OG-Fe(II) oxygenase family protein [Micromonospora sp. NPDC049662]|uniref:isopenicillin N synthase family dioxygenase n=1 Tax=Micromonospora sp. NPDC049662 TaxID=3155397 RepID=UPI00342B2D3D